ncbi:MAG: hypothetical protein ABIT71_01485 [Vicinamibacteraceae bacterium]
MRHNLGRSGHLRVFSGNASPLEDAAGLLDRIRTLFRRGMRLVVWSLDWIRSAMNKDKSSAKPHEKSYTLVIAVSFVIAVMMPFVRALATGDTQVAAAYATAAPAPAAHAALPSGGADELSLLVVGVFLLGLGSVLRRVA